jgi:hypothetical protein
MTKSSFMATTESRRMLGLTGPSSLFSTVDGSADKVQGSHSVTSFEESMGTDGILWFLVDLVTWCT